MIAPVQYWVPLPAGSSNPDSSEVPFTPTGDVASIDVQAAIAELDAEKASTGHNHNASYEASGTVATHSADTTSVHGIGDTSVLAVDSDLLVVPANRQTDSYVLVLGDAGKVIEMNKATVNDLTVPANASVAFPVDTVIEVFQYGAGQTTVVAAGGVTIRSSGGKLKLTGQYSAASLRKIATDEWCLQGDIAT